MILWLEVDGVGDTVRRFPLDQPSTRIGRAATSDIRISLPCILPTHVSIDRDGARSWHVSPAPRAPITIDGTPITGSVPLVAGTGLELGPVRLRVVAAPRTAPAPTDSDARRPSRPDAPEIDVVRRTETLTAPATPADDARLPG